MRLALLRVFILLIVGTFTVLSMHACKGAQPAAAPLQSRKGEFASPASSHPSSESVAAYRRCDLVAHSSRTKQACCDVGAMWYVAMTVRRLTAASHVRRVQLACRVIVVRNRTTTQLATGCLVASLWLMPSLDACACSSEMSRQRAARSATIRRTWHFEGPHGRSLSLSG